MMVRGMMALQAGEIAEFQHLSGLPGLCGTINLTLLLQVPQERTGPQSICTKFEEV